jgi:hypothetical protein
MTGLDPVNLARLFPSSCLASHERAWVETRNRRGIPLMEPQVNDMTWGTAATQHAVSHCHVDDDGFATAVTVRSGAKYWVVGHPKANVHDIQPWDKWDSECDPAGFNVGKMKYDWEGVLLRPGTVL